MHLYNITLQPPTAVSAAVVGNFSGTPKAQEMCLARNTHLEVARVDSATGRIESMLVQNLFATVRGLAAFRMAGRTQDYIVVTADGGGVAVLEYHAARNRLERVQGELFGRSEIRRTVPGEYLATDPRGRALLIGAVERQKLVYMVSRSGDAVALGSPLEAHRSGTVCFGAVGVDVGFENPVFAVLEERMGEDGGVRQLAYYEVDLGLNHVTRRWTQTAPSGANAVVALPGGTDGPSGVLVCSPNYVTWMHEGHASVRVPVPRRLDPAHLNQPEVDDSGAIVSMGSGVLIVASAVHRMRGAFFALLQSDEGDLFKLSVDFDAPDEGVSKGVTALSVQYFDTVAVASALCILRAGYLLVAAEGADHVLYQIESLGGDDDAEQPVFRSDAFEPTADAVVYFRPRALRNLSVADVAESCAPLVGAQVTADTASVAVACGRGGGNAAEARRLVRGARASVLAETELPGRPTGVWTVRDGADAEAFHALIVVSFLDATLVLRVGETVEEVSETAFAADVQTLAVGQLRDGSVVQVVAGAVRHFAPDAGVSGVSEWRAPRGTTIERAAINEMQVAVALGSGEVAVLEASRGSGGRLVEMPARFTAPARVVALALPPVDARQLRAPLLAVACSDATVRIVSLDPSAGLTGVAVQSVSGTPVSAAVLAVPGVPGEAARLRLLVGLESGVLLSTTVDGVTGALGHETRQQYLGHGPAQLVPLAAGAVAALSSAPWLVRSSASQAQPGQARVRAVRLLLDEALDGVALFNIEQCPGGYVGVSGPVLRIFGVERPDAAAWSSAARARMPYTGRRLALLGGGRVVVAASEAGVQSREARARIVADVEAGGDDAVEALDPEQFGVSRSDDALAAAGSLVVVDLGVSGVTDGQVLQEIELPDGAAVTAVGVCSVTFPFGPSDAAVDETRPEETRPDENRQETVVVASVVYGMAQAPLRAARCVLHTYRFNGEKLVLAHETEMAPGDVPLAICGHAGRVAVGVGAAVRLYAMGRKKLLVKCESTALPHTVVALDSVGDRLAIGDVQESVHLAVYRASEAQLVVFADDAGPRWTQAVAALDYSTVAVSDRFGSVAVLRVPADVNRRLADPALGSSAALQLERAALRAAGGGAPHKFETLCHFYVGDTVTALAPVTLAPGARPVIFYATLLGGLGALVPLATRGDVAFFSQLENALRTAADCVGFGSADAARPFAGGLVQRDHARFRGYYRPVCGVIDGDLCELFGELSVAQQEQFARDSGRSVDEVFRKIEGVRLQCRGF